MSEKCKEDYLFVRFYKPHKECQEFPNYTSQQGIAEKKYSGHSWIYQKIKQK